MSDPIENADESSQGGSTGDESAEPKVDPKVIERLVEERVAVKLKPIKDKLDNAFTARDEAIKKAETLEREKRDAELARLQEEGKHKEAYELQLKEERAEKEALKRQKIELTRNNAVRAALIGFDFRSEKASEMAFGDIVNQLVQDEKGDWIHRSGVSIREFAKNFADSDDNAFLFKIKASSGSGAGAPNKGSGPPEPKPLKERSQEEVIKLVSEGKLRRGG